METFTEKNLAGTLNFTTPGDSLQSGECLSITNWRPEQRGYLRSRFRETLLFSGFTAPIVGIFETGEPEQLYVADATGIWGIVNGNRVKLASNPNGAVTYFVNFQGYTWIMNPDVQIRSADGQTAEAWILSPPSTAPTLAAGGSSTGLNGTYIYACSFVTIDGIESNLSPTATITVTDQYVNLSAIPVSSDPTVTQVWVYRSGGTLASANPLRCLQLDNGTTTALDNFSDAAITLTDIEHTQDHDPPPAAAGLAGPDNYGHLFAWEGTTLYWSESETPWYWPGSQDVAGNYTQIGQDDDLIRNVTVKPRMIIIYKQASIWRIIGDVDTQYSVQEPIAVDRGLYAPRAIVTDGTLDYLDSDDGIYSCDGDRLAPLTRSLDNLWESGAFPTTPPFTDFFQLAYSGSLRLQCVMGRHWQNIFFSYPDQLTYQTNPTTPNTRTLVFNTETQRWTSDDRGWTSVFWSHAQQGSSYFYGGRGTQLFSIEDNVEAGINLYFCSRYYDFGKPRNQKTFVDFEIEFHMDDTADVLTVLAYFNNGMTGPITLGTISGPGAGNAQRVSQQFEVPLDTQAYNIAIALSGYATGTTAIYAFHFRYRLEQRDANTYDSGVSELGAPGLWKQVEAIAVDLELPAGNLTWKLYSDQTGTMTVAASGTLYSGGSTRSLVKIAVETATTVSGLSNGCAEGRLFRLVLSSTGTTTFRVYAAQFFMRVIGTYLNAGETLALLPQNFGTTRLRMFRRVDIDCEGGPYTLAVSTDYPGDALALRASFNQAAHGRTVDSFYLPQNTRGRFVQPVLEATAALRIYSARVWTKGIGEAGMSSWTWEPLPLLPTRETFEWFSLEVDS